MATSSQTHTSHNRSKQRQVEVKKRIYYSLYVSRCPVFQHLSHSAKKKEANLKKTIKECWCCLSQIMQTQVHRYGVPSPPKFELTIQHSIMQCYTCPRALQHSQTLCVVLDATTICNKLQYNILNRNTTCSHTSYNM